MSDYSEEGAVRAEDAAVDHPPTVDEVLERQRAEHPDQAVTSTMQPPGSGEEQATMEAGGQPSGRESDGSLDVEGPNPA